MTVKNVGILMESVCYAKKTNDQALKLALFDICAIPLSLLEKVQQPEEIKNIDKNYLLKIISMLTGAIKAL